MFYALLIACKQRDHAVAYARQLVEHGGAVEVRPLTLDALSID